MEPPSRRESEVLQLVGGHLSNPEIAHRLYISVRTVETHVAALIRKLGVADRRALVAYASALNRPGAGTLTPNRAISPSEATRTFLFTDVSGSTRLWQSRPVEAARLIQADFHLIAAAVEAHAGRVFKTTGDGTCNVFSSAPQALSAATDAQRTVGLPTRMAIHTGEAIEHDGDFFGAALSRCARLVDAAHGGQILVSAAATQVASDSLGQGMSLKHLGEHRLRDLQNAEPVFQLLADGLITDFPPLRTQRPIRHNLPASRSSFIGRMAERAQLQQLVRGETLVTLTGVGGCGKTRLALETASDVLVEFDDGVFFVDLSAVSDALLVSQAVASALDLQMPDPTPGVLADYFADRQMLLILDNCEHLLDACADLAETLASHCCPRVRILATSRESLGVEGEKVIRVPSLDTEGEAVALFVDRARDARPDLRVDRGSEATVAEICRRLDGLPLAIELAAARTAHLALTEILERLDDRFRLLVGGRRRIQRQQTLTAALDWSYQLLEPTEQQLLRRLAVFRGSFSLRAVEAICLPQALNLLGSLVAKSLVDLDDRAETLRYRLLESVRIYAEERLNESGESEQVRSAHRDWYLDWIETLPLAEVGSVALFGRSRVAAEADNLTAALEWCRQQRRYDLCARIAVRVASYWFSSVRLAEMMVWWRDLDAGLPADDHPHRAMALLLRSRAAFLAGEWDELNARSAKAAAMADPHSWIAVQAHYMQAMYWSMIDPPKSDRIFEQAFEIDATIDTKADQIPYQAYYLSRLLRVTDREEGLALLAGWSNSLGGVAPTPWTTALAALFALYGDTQRAIDLLPRPDTATLPMERFMAELSQAVVNSAQEKYDPAYQHLATLTSIVRDHAIPRGEAACLIGFAKVALDRGDHPRASRLLHVVKASSGPDDIPFRTHFDAMIYFHTTRALRSVMDPLDARKHQSEGTAMTLSEAIDSELADCYPPKSSRSIEDITSGTAD